MNTKEIIDVIPLVALPKKGEQYFSYLPNNLNVEIGALVEVPFSNQKVMAIVIERSKKVTPYKLKNIEKIVKKRIATEKEMTWLKDFADASFESVSTMSITLASSRKLLPNKVLATNKNKINNFSYKFYNSSENLFKFLLNNNNGQVLILVPDRSHIEAINKIVIKTKRAVCIWDQTKTKTDGESLLKRISEGDKCVIIAQHSGIFLPFVKLVGIVIIEPLSDSHMQWGKHPKYDARIGATLMAKENGIPLILYSNLSLTVNRYLGINKIKKEKIPQKYFFSSTSTNYSREVIPPEAINAIRTHVKNKKKILIFHNAVGFEGVYFCDSCGFSLKCDVCGEYLQKNDQNLICKNCNKISKLSTIFCARCGSPKITARHVGTKKIEQIFKREFPNYSIIRLDREQKKDNSSKNPHILITTQKIFSEQTKTRYDVCYIINFDSIFGFHSHDSLEKSLVMLHKIHFLLNKKNDGIVICNNGNKIKIIDELLRNTISQRVEDDINDRKKLGFPPFCATLTMSREYENEKTAITETKNMVSKMKKTCQTLVINWKTIEKSLKKYEAQIFLRGAITDLKKIEGFVSKKWSLSQSVPFSLLL